MIQVHRNHLNMWRAVLNACLAENNAWCKIPSFAASVSKLDILLTQAEVAEAAYQYSVLRTNLCQKQYMDKVVTLALKLAVGACAYALDQRDDILYCQLSNLRDELASSTDVELYQRIAHFLESLAPIETALIVGYGIPAGCQANTLLQLHALKGETLFAGSATNHFSDPTDSIDVITARGDAVLQKLDGLVSNLRSKHLEFTISYSCARAVIDKPKLATSIFKVKS